MPLAGADHQGGRVARPDGIGQAMISTATAAVNAAATDPPVPTRSEHRRRQGDADPHEIAETLSANR